MRQTALTAHSGCEGTPENSLESIRTGIALGADCVEVDVRLSPDGTLMLAHDIPECADGLVTLEQAFGMIADSDVSINCDLKEYAALYPVLQLAQRCGIGREKLIFSGSVDVKLLLQDHSIAQRSRVFLNSEELCRYMMPGWPCSREAQAAFFMENLPEIVTFMHGLGVEALNAPYRYVSEEAIGRLHELGVALSLWTVDDEADMRCLFEKGILSLTTRCVHTALRVRADVQL